MSTPPKNESHIAWLKDQLAVWEDRLREAQVAAAEVANCKEHIRLLKTSLATAEGTPPESSTASNPQKYARMRLPEAIIAYLEEHRSSVDIQRELLPDLLD